ncbi:MAG TPA: ferredoxin [Rectinemataceae bacterium]|nr:ferredoxin [Rectinemataceae bacterium]
MADKSSRNPGNVAGKWYVDSTCIGCGLCNGTAPDIFSMTDDGSRAFVAKQPVSGGETKLAVQALGDCPVDAIGNDA